ncbi:hypothetical protein A3D00_02790 [Candidatus Woesebacteria bacterium RIFCSPHIGHO2_02_FULL_38_9]|uniref:Uncharacterized protein n=1 Tax=Candidatus Woesebacteria bacterium RIFCSPHIGHO2_01_FULL_39_28 TaxID=1802496 RepID=A0A1F7YGB4_9BACT|nr:MAG: hypothetical protein A2627_04380 [Candidatus Woesebacteria bacterium RIFCSPHIGHO2_01_FULL_39_28]OGM35176.1 MAG: hypothetical protein A3D00_02790 [Candidatus Woesebacteria bacterium RIFCSPHIGHO2_02_FULL_38_9]OGM57765.1 MAG: hypothetical protein A3A50_05640 [Candidatus Woesebacteria bacterium RIFCSPLOWO2_01_FULL_38_20]
MPSIVFVFRSCYNVIVFSKNRQENILNIITRSKKADRDLVYQKKFEEREEWHRLVVKVIIWKDGTVGEGVVQLVDKITSKEWEFYCGRITKANIVNGKDRIQIRLNETLQRIKENGGFC